jgi:uncharacterized protein (DUF488 family)
MATLYTIGHSDRTLEEFVALLQVYNIKQVIDIRSIPKSRHVPWTNEKDLSRSLGKVKISYIHLASLGGLRSTHKDSINQAWINASFRGFADYMQTPEFFQGLKTLNALIKKTRTVIMCAEAVPWRCHRSLIGDAEIIRGIKVLDIMSLATTHQHELTKFAVVDRTKRPIKIYYPKEE